ncbi:hypothetical protein [uncultured Fibrella sp.]|uniref:hypothetical protein n=1 Tax=uncultured Fibrella sp. TaxID=1284596 RepID=UPI0035CC957A
MHLSTCLLGFFLTFNGPAVQTTGWQYQETAEPSTGTTYKASLNATNLLQLPYPYAGGSVVTLTIRSRSGTTTAYLSVSKGLLAPSFQGGKALIRFDAGKPVTYALSAAANGRGNLLFFDDAQRLIRQLRSSKTMTLQLKVIGQNLNDVNFTAAGLRWNY